MMVIKMAKCQNCGEEVEDSSVFCQNCGSKIEIRQDAVVNVKPVMENDGFEAKKLNAMIILGYLTLFIQIAATLASWYNVKVVNSDRIILYPLLSVILVYFVSFNMIKSEKTFIHGLIIPVVSILLFILGIAV